MVAFISVLTVFITVVVNTSVKNNSEIKVSVINWQRTFVAAGQMYQVLNAELFVTNAGRRPGMIKTVAIRGNVETQFQSMRSESTKTSDEYSHEEVKSHIVEPGKTLLLKRYLKTLLTVDEFTKKYTNADIRVQIVDFNGREKEVILKMRDRPPYFYR